MSGTASKGLAAALTLGLMTIALVYVFSMVQVSRSIDTPMPFVGLIVGGLMFGALWLGPVGRGIGRMFDAKPAVDDQVLPRLEQLEAQLLDSAGMDLQRVAELEERLDFAERLLAAQRDMPERLS